MIRFAGTLPSMFRALEWSFYFTFPHVCQSSSIASFGFDYAKSIQCVSGWEIIKMLFEKLACKRRRVETYVFQLFVKDKNSLKNKNQNFIFVYFYFIGKNRQVKGL